jgi:acetyl esterase/lipase
LVSFYGYGDIKGAWYSRPDPFYSSSEKHVSRQEAESLVGREARSEAKWEENRFRFYLYCRQQGLWPKEVTGRDPDLDAAAFKPWCPLQNVGVDYPPTMLLHADKDTDVPFVQSVEMARELKSHGIESQFIPIPGYGHGFDGQMEDPVVSKAFDQVIGFLDRHVR